MEEAGGRLLRRGSELLERVNGVDARRIFDSLADIAPDVGRWIVEFAYGDVYARPGLEPRQRQLVTLGALTALGGCESQLAAHVNSSLNVGLAPSEIVEAIVQVVPYAGFPRVLNGIAAARAVFAERGLLPVVTPEP